MTSAAQISKLPASGLRPMTSKEAKKNENRALSLKHTMAGLNARRLSRSRVLEERKLQYDARDQRMKKTSSTRVETQRLGFNSGKIDEGQGRLESYFDPMKDPKKGFVKYIERTGPLEEDGGGMSGVQGTEEQSYKNEKTSILILSPARRVSCRMLCLEGRRIRGSGLYGREAKSDLLSTNVACDDVIQIANEGSASEHHWQGDVNDLKKKDAKVCGNGGDKGVAVYKSMETRVACELIKGGMRSGNGNENKAEGTSGADDYDYEDGFFEANEGVIMHMFQMAGYVS